MKHVDYMPNAYPLLDTRQDNSRTLITVLAIMVFLASLSVLFVLSAQRFKHSLQSDLGRNATIQLLIETPQMRDLKLETAMNVLKSEFPNADIKIISTPDANALLQPWLGNVSLPEDLPIPSLVAVSFEDSNALNIPALKTKLEDEGLRAEIDDHSRWSDQINRTGNGLLANALALLALIFLACASVSAFATQSALSAQKDVIRVLVQVGAADNFITRLFISQAGRRGLVSGFIGVVFGAIISFILNLRHNPDTALIPELSMKFSDIFYLCLLAIFIAIICACAAGVTSFRLLQKEHRRA